MGVNGIYGLSGSGLDIESMVKVGMMSKQNEYDKMAQKYTTNEWTKNALVEINNQITTYNMSALSDYKYASKMKAKSAESSNELAVTATANANAPIMSHKVDVKELSSNAYLISYNKISDIIDANGGDTNKALLSDILFKDDLQQGWHKVTSTYTAGFSSHETNDGVDTYTLSANGVLTNTQLNVKDGQITGVKYKSTSAGSLPSDFVDVDSTKTKIELLSAGATKTTSFDLGEEFGITLNFNPVKNANGTTTIGFPNGGIVVDPNSQYKGEFNIAISNISGSGWEATFTPKFKAGNGHADGDLDNNATFTVKANYTTGEITVTSNVKDSSTGNIKTESLTGEDSNYTGQTRTTIVTSAGALTTTETRQNGAIVDNSFTSAKFVASEYGIIGTSQALTISNGELTPSGTVQVSDGFQQGQKKSISENDLALSFTISDGVTKDDDDNLKEIEIKYTYADLFNGKSMNDLYSDINTKATEAGINVRASFDNLNSRFSIYNSKGDAENQVIINVDSNNMAESDSNVYSQVGKATTNFLNNMGLRYFNGEELEKSLNNTGSGGTWKAEGKNGIISVDGIDYETKDNKVTVGDVIYTATQRTGDYTGVETTDADGYTIKEFKSEGPVTVTVGQDVEGIVDRVKSFVESYNKILSSLYEKYDEKNDSNYKPLTQSQKDSMKEEQIEKWEEKAKQGLLYHDQTLSKIIGQMRNAVSASVEVDGQNYSVFSLGISTTGLKGQLTLDEDKLRAALAENGDAVYNTFSKLTTTKDATGKDVTDYNKSGVAQRLADVFTNATKLIKSRAGSSADIAEDSELNNLLRELQTKMSNFRKLMNAFEDRLYKKYDAMEVALSKLGSQLNFITGGQ